MPVNKKGQTLIEVAITLGIASIVITGLVILAASSIRQAQNSVRQITATKLSNAGIEAVIFYKNYSGFEAEFFKEVVGDPTCVRIDGNRLQQGSCNGHSVITNNGLQFTRVISIVHNGGGDYTVTSTVSYEVANQQIDSVTNVRKLTKWK